MSNFSSQISTSVGVAAAAGSTVAPMGMPNCVAGGGGGSLSLLEASEELDIGGGGDGGGTNRGTDRGSQDINSTFCV